MDDLLNFLEETAGTGEIITLAYGGGSRPGQARDLLVASCSDDSIRAIESGARAQKQYKIEKILWVENAQGQRVENQAAAERQRALLPRLESLSEYISLLEAKYENAGWHIHKSDEMFGVGSYFKNGKPKKTPSIAIAFFDPSTEVVWDIEANGLVEKQRSLTGRERPWRVDSWRFKEGKTFGLLYSAMELFMEEVEASNPTETKGMYAGH